jgi:DNA gyrase subunit B
MAEYSTSSIVVLKGLEAIRRRPGMYVGDTADGTGLHHLLWELLGNAVDEHLRGTATRVSVHIDGDTITVEDDGRGVPVEVPPGQDKTALELIFTTMHGGSSRWGGRPHVHLAAGLHGVGVAPVTALAERLEVTVWRDGRIHRADFARGEMIGIVRNDGPTTRSGTRVRFTPDFEILTRRPWDAAAIRERLRTLAAFNPRLTLRLHGDTFCTPDGLADYARHLARDDRWLHAEPIRIQGTHADVEVDTALLWTEREGTEVRGFVSQAPTQRGTHMDGFWLGWQRAFASLAPGRLAHVGLSPMREVLGPGLVAVVHAGLYHARWGDPRRDRLVNPEVCLAVAEIVAESLRTQLREQSELLGALLRRLPPA